MSAHDWASAHAVCDEALRITQNDRNEDNGNAEDNFAFIAMTWTALLQARGLLDEHQTLDAADVARMMIGLKLCRDANAPHRDNRVDTIGYALCLERVESTEMTVSSAEDEDHHECSSCLYDELTIPECEDLICRNTLASSDPRFKTYPDRWKPK